MHHDKSSDVSSSAERMKRGFRFRDAVQLLLVILAGWAAAQWLQQSAPLGRDVRTNQIARALVQDSASPTAEVSNPTLTLVVFTDYRCAACRAAHPDMLAALEKDGQVRVIYKDWPIFGARSERTARVALAADRQGIYAALHDALMTERRALDDAVLQELVEQAGGSWQQILIDLDKHGAQFNQQLGQNAANAYGLGLSGTPSYLAGLLLVEGALDETEFTRLFADARELAR